MTQAVVGEGLAVKAARGVIWTGGGQIARQIIQVGTALVLVRLLAPNDFGLIGMAMFFVGIGQLLADFGIGSAIVQARSTERIVLSSCFWLNLLVATLMAIVVVACAPLVGLFYQRPDVVPIVVALAATLPLSGLQVVPASMLHRGMRFADLSGAQVLGTFGGALFAIGLAASGAGVWSLVVQPLAGSTITLVCYGLAARWYPRFEFSWQPVAPLARFGAAMLGTSLATYASRNVDSLLVGRVLGASALGYYSMAIQIMLFPLQHVSSVIVRVLFPTLVQIRDEMSRVRAAYLNAVSSIALVTFPLMGGLYAVADDFVLVLFGETWIEMSPVLKVLAWVGMVQSVATTMGTLYLATGRADIALRVTLVGTPVLVAGMAAGLLWGIVGVAVGYACATFLLFYYTAGVAFRLVDLKLAQFHRVLIRPLMATFGMVGLLVVVHDALLVLSPPQRLSAQVLLGVASYALATAMINRAQVTATWRVVRTLLQTRHKSTAR